MKRLTIILVIGLISSMVFAQVPHSFSYQAVVRGNNGEPIAYQNTNFRISLLLGSDTGPISFQETHLQTTNFFGLVNLQIGNGTVVTGVFDTLSWSSQSYYIKVEADTSGGSNFIALGTTQLLAVPYAMHAENATSAVASSMIQDSDQDTRVTTELYPDVDKVHFLLGNTEKMRLENDGLVIKDINRNIIISDSISPYASATVDNTILGFSAGQDNQDGLYNTFIGMRSGWKHVHGSDNTYIGVQSGREDLSGNLNTFIGCDAGVFSKTGSRNTFVGYGAGLSNNEGSYNTYLGYTAGAFNGSGNSNVFLGYEAGRNITGSNLLAIENSDASDPLIYGEFDNDLLRFNANRIDVRNPLENTIVGDNTGYATNGSRNVYLGTRAVVAESPGSQNVMIGYEAGSHNTTGDWGLMAGYQAGSANTTGDYNVFLGWNTGNRNTTGHRNTFIGPNAGSSNTTGLRNVYVGLSTGAFNSTGSFNTFVGRAAGMNNASGSDNVFLGDMAGANEMGSNKLYIANSETPEPLIYGDFIEKKVKLWADTLEVEGVTSTGDKFSVGGEGGISDTLFAITSFDFTSQKIKYRKQVIKGGITIELTGESAWMDTINRQDLFCGDGVTDPRDGQHYASVLIGEQCWMAENLNVGTMVEGTIEQSENETIEKYCYDNSEENCNIYGGLYQWHEVLQYASGSQGICPDGWHVPSDAEYKIMEGNVDSQFGEGDPEWDLTGWRGFDAGLNLKATEGWAESGNGSDAFGFHALPGGRLVDGDGFSGRDSCAFFWVFSPDGSGTPYFRNLKGGFDKINRETIPAGHGFSLRCIKGQGIESPSVETANLTSITGTTATGGGNITADGGDPVTARGVVWSTAENPTLSDSFTTDGSGTGEFTSNMTGLVNETRYYVRAYATNNTGTIYGQQLAFTTPGGSCPGGATVDWQGKTYNTVMIGNQCWLKENLDVGTMIDITIEQSDNGILEKYCYDNNPANCLLYGGFYLWNEMMQYVSQQGSQGICPSGWHVASDDEWKVLEGAVDSQYGVGDAVWEINGTRGSDAGLNLKSTSGWNDNGNGMDPYGFSGLPGGFCWPGGGFGYINQYSAYWTSSEIQGTENAWDRGLNSANAQVDRMSDNKSGYGQTARCLNNQTSLPVVTTATVTGITQTSATSGGNVTSVGGSAATARGVCWSTSEFPTLYDDHTTDGAGTGNFTSNITGLSANTQYHVRAYATSSMGTAYGSSILFITQGESCPDVPTVTWGGQTYQTVQIGNQCWLEENLNVGTMIAGIKNQTNNDTIEKYCYNDDPNNCLVYGALYQWNEAMQYNTAEGSQGICPDGWHVPSDAEFKILEGTVDTHFGVGDPEWNKVDCRGEDAGTHLKSFSGWPEWCEGDNLSGFNYLCSQGYRNTNGTFFSNEGGSPLWSSSQYNSNSSWPRTFPCHMGGLCRNYDDNRLGWSIRCIKD